MGKVHLYASRFPESQEIANTNRITFATSIAHLKFQNCFWLLLLLTAGIAMCVNAPVVRAQGKIILMEKAGKQIWATDEVKRIVGTTRNSESISKVPMNIEMGDVLVGSTGAVTVKLTCNDVTEKVLSGQFKVRFFSPLENGDCNSQDEGKKDSSSLVRASGPTHVKNGAIKMGTRRTWYQIRNVRRRDLMGLLGGPPEILVFEGEVTIRSRLFSGVIKEGMKLVSDRSCPLVIKKLAPRDFRRAAEIYARLDVSQIADPRDVEAVTSKMVSLHQAVLENPHNPEKLIELRKAQEELGIPISDAIHLDNQSRLKLEVRQDTPSNSPHRNPREFRQRVRKSNLALRRQARA